VLPAPTAPRSSPPAGGGRRECPRLGATHGSRDRRQAAGLSGQPCRRCGVAAGQDVGESWQARGRGRGTASRGQRRPCLGTAPGGMQTGTGVGARAGESESARGARAGRVGGGVGRGPGAVRRAGAA